MAVIDQVLLLQEKVESAVQKIVELKSENDALRRKCSELTNALSEKTELLNSFTADEEKIELSIKNAINRLDTLENDVISGGTASAVQTPVTKVPAAEVPVQKTEVSEKTEAPVQKTEIIEETEKSVSESGDIDFSLDLSTDSEDTTSKEENQPEEKFDIF